MKIIGTWRDILVFNDGHQEFGEHGEFEWGFNQIQNSFATLLATWARAETGYDRIGFIGIGSGLVSWDTTPPAQPYSNTTLTTEVFRKAIPQLDIDYIDPITNISTGGTPSSKIEITYTLGTSEANFDLREFGLFGGTATISFDSGQMVNWVVHSKITKDSSFEIHRRIRLQFAIQ